ncbi:hypothetical protein F4861DRAFT_549012 [Xylaria intraflava]|nr:hypothetical protein F4861DRAFT_549012 [Xylaria intraflava]
MCHYWATTFPCGCPTWRSSGYNYCEKRGTKSCKPTLSKHLWTTFCPTTRRALHGKKYTPDRRLPACCDHLTPTDREALCGTCDSLPPDASGGGPGLWHCPGHLEVLGEFPADLAEAEAFFERALKFWPPDHRARYLRRKADKSCRGVWWSL